MRWKKTSTDNVHLNRNDWVGTRGWVRVAQVPTLSCASDDTVVRHLKVDILHANGIVTIRTLGGARHIGTVAVRIARAAQVAIDLDVALSDPDGVAGLVVPGAGAGVAGGGADLGGVGAAEAVVVLERGRDGAVLEPEGEFGLDGAAEGVVPGGGGSGAGLVGRDDDFVAAGGGGAVDDLARVLPVAVGCLSADDEEVGPAMETVDGGGVESVVARRGHVAAASVGVLAFACGEAWVGGAVGEVVGEFANISVSLENLGDLCGAGDW